MDKPNLIVWIHTSFNNNYYFFKFTNHLSVWINKYFSKSQKEEELREEMVKFYEWWWNDIHSSLVQGLPYSPHVKLGIMPPPKKNDVVSRGKWHQSQQFDCFTHMGMKKKMMQFLRVAMRRASWVSEKKEEEIILILALVTLNHESYLMQFAQCYA